MRITLGITGCIGAYKTPELIRLFQRHGHSVRVVATRHALKFVSRLTLETISRHPLTGGLFARPGQWEVEHISLARQTDVLLVAPATANILAKFAAGIADDFLSTLYLSVQCPVAAAPAMNSAMWQHPATRRNLEILRNRGVRIVEPERGYLACGEEGAGRLAGLPVIMEAAIAAGTPASLTGQTWLITAGPTSEDLDPVRFITNRSTGRMGYCLAREASRRGARVILISGPGHEPVDFPGEVIRVRRADEMLRAVLDRSHEARVVIMAAAVADYTPAQASPCKIKKGQDLITLELRRTEDILARLGAVRQPGQFLAGFAAETENVEENARRKLAAKRADLIVANRVGAQAGFGSHPSEIMIIGPDGVLDRFESTDKMQTAGRIIGQIESLSHPPDISGPGPVSGSDK